jgi:hypothetical protein
MYSGPSRNLIRRVRNAVRKVHPDVELFDVSYGVGTRLHQDLSVKVVPQPA